MAHVRMVETGEGLAGEQFQPTLRLLQMAGFSSTHSTRAYSGEFRYRRTMSTAFRANVGSVLRHQERRRSRLIPCARNTRQM